jgi:hypothetical protein
MHSHSPSCLKGPVTQDHPWWAGTSRKPRKRSKSASRDIRTDLVARVRQEIAAGTYDTPERWATALDGLARNLRLA